MGEIDHLAHTGHFAEQAENFLRLEMVERFHGTYCVFSWSICRVPSQSTGPVRPLLEFVVLILGSCKQLTGSWSHFGSRQSFACYSGAIVLKHSVENIDPTKTSAFSLTSFRENWLQGRIVSDNPFLGLHHRRWQDPAALKLAGWKRGLEKMKIPLSAFPFFVRSKSTR